MTWVYLFRSEPICKMKTPDFTSERILQDLQDLQDLKDLILQDWHNTSCLQVFYQFPLQNAPKLQKFATIHLKKFQIQDHIK